MSKAHAYEVKEHSVEDLLSPAGVTFEVPTFQRRYSWGREEVEELLDDLYGNDDWMWKQGEALPYFLGSIVLARGAGGADFVLDGQQRLTTVSLLVAVLKHKMQELGHPEAEKLNDFLEAGKIGQKKKPKIKPQQEDAPIYMALYKNPQGCYEPTLKKNLIAGAVRTLMAGVKEHAEKLADSHDFSIAESLEHMTSRLIYGVEFVRITAPSEAAAFRLFETLNDRGLELSAADLVKNKLFAQCGSGYLEDVRDLWRDITDAVGESELVSFLRNYLISRGTPVRKNDLYDKLKTQIEELKQPPKVMEFVADVRAAAFIYRELMVPSSSLGWNSEVVESLKRLNTFRARSGRPALLACAQLNPQKFPEMVRAIEIVAVRYSVIGQSKPVVLEKAYATMCKDLRQDSNDVKGAINKLGSAMPDDNKFAATFADLNIDTVTNAWREILIALNNAVATGETRVNGPDKVHVEHILPRKPSKKALTEAKLTTEEAEELSGCIGNLTLLSGKKNQTIGNKEFSHKKPVFEASEIALNTSIASDANVIWGRDEIEARSKALAADAVKTWPWVFS